MGTIGYSNFSLTGDCSNTSSGAMSIQIVGTSPDFFVFWGYPLLGSYGPFASGDVYTETNLSGGSYTFTIVDSDSAEQPIVFNISTGTCVSIDGVLNTTCGYDNGAITASTSSIYNGNANFYLYETTNGYITSANTTTTSTIFYPLSAGTYYVVADDGGGCTGMSESCIVKDSSAFTYNLYIVDNAGCAGTNSGAVYVTDLNGVGPYTYNWEPGGQTTSSITGLTAGTYSVIVTDSTGCQVSNSAVVNVVPPVGLGSFVSVQPTCLSSDGQLTVTVTGGTAPYYFSGSNGDSAIVIGQTYTFSGLAPGYFTVQVTDAGLCSFTATQLMQNVNGFSVLSISTVNSTCSVTSGQIIASIFGGAGTYQYTISDGITTTSYITTSTSYNFTNLDSGTYQITISGGTCVYTTSVTVYNEASLNLTYNYTGATCNNCDGVIELIASGETEPYTYQLVGPTPILINSYPFSSITITNLCPGNYVGYVTANDCTVTENILLPSSPNVFFSLYSTNPTPLYYNNGTVSAFITSGTPPFSWTWSPNVNGQTGLTVTNLTAGTYSLTVEDSNGCIFTQSVTITGFIPVSAYQIYNICNDDFMNTGLLLTKGPKQMLNEGFYDLTSGDTNCILNKAYFTAIVTIDGVTTTDTFYTGTTLNDYPSDDEWAGAVTDLLLTYNGITGVTTNIEENTISITAPCNTLSGAQVSIDMLISYDINCEELGTTTTTTTIIT